jgi:hypothetical protein
MVRSGSHKSANISVSNRAVGCAKFATCRHHSDSKGWQIAKPVVMRFSDVGFIARVSSSITTIIDGDAKRAFLPARSRFGKVLPSLRATRASCFRALQHPAKGTLHFPSGELALIAASTKGG